MPTVPVHSIRHEWPTWLTLASCYIAWLLLLLWHRQIGWLWIPLTTLLITLHSSLQHEMLHGHPTRSKVFNELLVFLALGLFIPYRRFRDLHLQHHRNEKLTDPYDDPESWYLTEADWLNRSYFLKMALQVNATLAGRMLIGPLLSLYAFWRDEMKAVLSGDRQIAKAWAMHLLGLTPVVLYLAYLNIDLWFYALAVAYPGMSVLMIRTFIEHRADEQVKHRTAVVEAGRLMSFLFLNNNLHAVHHQHPTTSWYALPALWKEQRSRVLADNGHYHFPDGYLSVADRWLFNKREPVVHPILYKKSSSDRSN